MKRRSQVRLGAVAVLLLAACADQPEERALLQPSLAGDAAPSAPLATLTVAGEPRRVLPYLTDDLETLQDPVNLVFSGHGDPREIRDALLGLDGSRGAPFPAVFPFDCTWTDAIGGLMAGYGEDAGWSGAAIQLQCGRYGPLRFHLRLVKLGSFTVGNAHFELLIPGTTDHQVLSWELAEQLVTYDMARTGLLGVAPGATAAINAAPVHRGIPALIYNGLPPELRQLAGGPLSDVVSDVGIVNDGSATVLALAGTASPAPSSWVQREEIPFDQIIPKPFCALTGAPYLQVRGTVELIQEVEPGPAGELRQRFSATGRLEALPLDPATGLPAGEAFRAEVSERQDTRAGADGGTVSGLQQQQLLPAGLSGAGSLAIRLSVAPGRTPQFDRRVICR
jgi:hypothetical protein